MAIGNYQSRRRLLTVTLFLGTIVAISGCGKEPGSEAPQNGMKSAEASPTPPVVAATPAESRPAVVASPTPAAGGDKSAFKSTSPIPEMMTRPFTKEEMDKALQQLPPEVRARLQGLSLAPAGVTPAPLPSPSPKRR